jgi:hypothetical protein
VDYIESYSIPGLIRDVKDIECIALYRRLTNEETKIKFEEYRNNNYKKDKGISLLPILRRDIEKYEEELKKL